MFEPNLAQTVVPRAAGSQRRYGYDVEPGSITPAITRGNSILPDLDEALVGFEHDLVARFVLDTRGNILRANIKARALVASGILGAGGALVGPSHRIRPELDALLIRLVTGRQTFGRMLVRGGDDAWCLLDLSSAPGFENRVFATARWATAVDTDRLEPLRREFGLTRAETSVLTHLAAGEAPKDIGRKMDMSIHTVRAHLRAICMRMGVRGINGALRLCFQLTS